MVTLTDKQKRRAITGKEAACLAETLGKYIAEQIEPLKARIAALERVKYLGTWEDAKNYVKGQWVTYKGVLWHCNADVGPGVAPGTSKCWQLTGKSHR